MKQVVELIKKYRLVLISLIILALFGYTLLKIQAISNPQPDSAYIRSQRKNQPTKIEIKDELRKQLEQLVNTSVDVQPDALGNPDPFNP
ncbi:hypothetical protein HY441_01080 [Candidatus Microgenomates bacterium]|nr:hypothetical protein [Candidatus Microgenomates bacterium]